MELPLRALRKFLAVKGTATSTGGVRRHSVETLTTWVHWWVRAIEDLAAVRLVSPRNLRTWRVAQRHSGPKLAIGMRSKAPRRLVDGKSALQLPV